MPMTVELLWGLEQTALILLEPSGITFTNQVGGTGCEHPTAEGILVPVGHDHPVERPELGLTERLWDMDWGSYGGITSDFEDEIEEVLSSNSHTAHIRVDRNRLRDHREAWIHVVVGASDPQDPTQTHGRPGILTWPNSD